MRAASKAWLNTMLSSKLQESGKDLDALEMRRLVFVDLALGADDPEAFGRLGKSWFCVCKLCLCLVCFV